VRDFFLATQDIHAYTDGDWVVGVDLVDGFRNPPKAYYAAR
jgi:hypothetical protein